VEPEQARTALWPYPSYWSNEVCHLWNLSPKKRAEGAVFQRLFQKLEEERTALGGKVFDILGKMTFDNRPLRDLLIEAVRYGNDPDVRARLWQVVDHSMNQDALRSILEERALTEDTMDISRVMAIREDMERIEAHKLQPHFIEAFFVEAFRSVGGQIRPRESGRYEVVSVPFAVRSEICKSVSVSLCCRAMSVYALTRNTATYRA
jgi:hypothetical protein